MEKNLAILILIISIAFTATSQVSQQSMRLTPEEIEGVFLRNNLELIAEMLHVDIADAAIAQAKLWDNPQFAIDGLNLWSTSAQRGGEKEVIPPLFGTFGRNTQFSVELTQMITLAAKRGKLVIMERISKEIAIAQFEDVLRGLKAELRKTMNEIIYLELYRSILISQTSSLGQLIEAYSKQVTQGNLAKSELLRLQAALFEIENESNEVQMELSGSLKNLRILLNADASVSIEIVDNRTGIADINNINLPSLLDLATESRPDVVAMQRQKQYYEKSIAYEKSRRVPDLSLGVQYDRWGGVWRDYVGFNAGISIPVFNRNQGAIRAAKISTTQSEMLAQHQQSIARNEVAAAYRNFLEAYHLHQKVVSNPMVGELDGMLELYSKNLFARNISMLEYIDFIETYKKTKQAVLNAQKNLYVQFDELQYTVGTEIK